MTAELADEGFEPRILDSELAFHGRVWDVRRERFEYGDAVLTRDFVAHTGAVAILALDEEDRVLLIKQYRHPLRVKDWEIPAGLLDIDGEAPLAAAERELAEEVDLTAASWALLADYANSPGGSDEALRIYLARDLTPTGTVFAREGEEADIERRWVPLEEAVDAVRAGRVQNSATIIGLLSAWVERARGWSGLKDPETPWTRHRKR